MMKNYYHHTRRTQKKKHRCCRRDIFTASSSSSWRVLLLVTGFVLSSSSSPIFDATSAVATTTTATAFVVVPKNNNNNNQHKAKSNNHRDQQHTSSSLFSLLLWRSKKQQLQQQQQKNDDDDSIVENPFTTLFTSPNNNNTQQQHSAMAVHHTAIKTRNITLGTDFYAGLFGFRVVQRFRTGPARAAWLEDAAGNSRIELIEVPRCMLNEPEDKNPAAKRTAIDLMNRQELLGLNHIAFDVTEQIHYYKRQEVEDAKQQQDEPTKKNTTTTTSATAKDSNNNDSNNNTSNRTPAMPNSSSYGLSGFLNDFNRWSLRTFRKTLRIALEPKQQMIGSAVYEIAFLYDPDGTLIELLHKQTELPQSVSSGWEPLQRTTIGATTQRRRMNER